MPLAAAVAPLTDEQREFAARPENLRFCRFAAAKFGRRCRAIPVGDFYQAAAEGLLDAVRLYDPERGVHFEHFAPRRIEGACLDLMRAGGLVRVPRGEQGEIPRVLSADLTRMTGGADAMHPPDPAPPADAELEAAETFESLLADLPAVHRFILRKRFAEANPWSHERIGEHLDGITASRVIQIQSKALAVVAGRAMELGLAHADERTRFPRKAKERTGYPRGASPECRRGPWLTPLPCEAEALPGFLDRLGPQQRAAVILRYGLDDGRTKTLPEVAAALAVNQGVAGYRIREGLVAIGRMAGTLPPPGPRGDAGHPRIEHDGRSLTVRQWAAERGMPRKTLLGRLNLGWDVARAIDTPVSAPRRIEHDGRSLTVAQWAREAGLPPQTLLKRINNGWSMERAIGMPPSSTPGKES